MTQRNTAREIIFKQLFDTEYNNFCRYALSYLHDTQLAEDAVQEVFIKLWEHKKELVESSDIRFYLIAVVRNKCISIIRKQKKKVILFDNIPQFEQSPSSTSLQQKEELLDQAKKIANALNELPPKCKDIFLLIKMHDMSYKQAAKHLNLSVKTIENQMGKAFKILRIYSNKMSIITMLILVLYSII